MTQIIFINGAPRAGKDTVAGILFNHLADCYRLGFADHLKRATHAAYGMFDIPIGYFESCKDEPNDLFFGFTPRQAYINHSEFYMKPFHGNEIFGKMWLRGADALPNPQFIVIPDSGFESEANPVAERYGRENCFLLRVEREGCTFASDSRSHIKLDGIRMAIVTNNGTLVALRRYIIDLFDIWLPVTETFPAATA